MIKIMPKCAKCYEMLPPNFCAPISAEDVQCLFCENEITEITINRPGGKVETYTKEECKNDYLKLMNMMKEKTEKLKEAKAAADFSKSDLILPGSQEFEDTLKGR
jgi:hypothetical protein